MTVINLNDALEERITETENKLQTAVAVKAETKVIAALSRELTQLRNTLACNVKAEPASDEEDRQRFEDIEVLKADIRLNVLSQFDYYYVQIDTHARCHFLMASACVTALVDSHKQT